jgi:muconate cycloisomerase
MSESPIERVELVHVVLPPRREHKWTGATEPIGGYLLVKLIAQDGSAGWGECTALKDWAGEFGRYFGESVAIARTVIERYLAPAAKGVMPSNLVELHARMDRAIKGYPYAKAAMDIGAHDLAGKQLGVPVHVLLGGALRRTIPITHSIGFIPIEDAER